MADQPWAVAFAIGVQSGFGSINATIAALSGSKDSSDGFVLGDKASGDAESGITIPNFERIVREAQQVAASWTQQADHFLRTAVNSLAISYPTQGNGLDAGAPTQDAASLAATLLGRDAIYQCTGLTESTGAADPDIDYDPRATTVYATIKIWIGSGSTGMSYVFIDCVCETLAWAITPSGNCIETASFKVGALNAAAVDVTFPTIDYTTQVSLAAPVVAGVTFSAFGQARGFENLVVTCQNDIEEFQDSSVALTGIRQAQTARRFLVDGTLYVALADVDAAYIEHINTSAPTNDMTIQVGTADVGGAETALNAFLFAINNLEAKGIKYNRVANAVAVELSGCKATAPAAGGEFSLTFN